MKKLTYLAVAAIAALSSCSSDDIATGNNITSESVGVTEFTATIDNGNGITSRTAYDATNRYATWIANTDQISVNGYTYRAKDTGSTTAFTSTGDEAAAADTYTAYYPATMYDNGTISMPASYNYSTNSPYNMPMYAESSTTALSFKNLTGVIALTVPSTEMETVKSITVTSDQHLSGECTINYNSGAPTISWTNATATDAEKQVKINCGAGAAATTFYIPVPAGSHTNLTFTVSNGTATKAMKAKTAITIARNTLYSLTFVDNCSPTSGTAAVTDGTGKNVTSCGWVKLWAGGPKWATMNVGAATITDYGGYYKWGMSTNKDTSDSFNYSTLDISGTDDDTAKNLWGSNWKMPKKTDLDKLLSTDYTDGGTWVTSYNGVSVSGLLVKGKTNTAYASNEIFFPAAGDCNVGDVDDVGYDAFYWSSTPYNDINAYCLYFNPSSHTVTTEIKGLGCSVRAVLAE